MTTERWQTFSKREQLLFIGSEFERARVWQRDSDVDKFKSALARALELIDLTISDKKWLEEIDMIIGLREAVSKFYTGEDVSEIHKLYQAL